jgi:YbbR domain-containing protein
VKANSSRLQNMIFENGSYKLVALFVTLILWVTILGRRDFVLSKQVDVEFLLPKQTAISEAIERKVEVKVSGPRMALRKFAQNPGTITIDLGKSPVGPNRAIITPHNVEVPFGVKVISVVPEEINITLVHTPSPDSVDEPKE